MDLGFVQRHRDAEARAGRRWPWHPRPPTQHSPRISRIPAHVGRAHPTAGTHFLQRTIVPGFKTSIELLRAATDLSQGDVDRRADQPLRNFDDFARGGAACTSPPAPNPRTVPDGYRTLGRLCRNLPSHSGHLKGVFFHLGEHGLRLIAVGLIDSLGAAPVGQGLKMTGALHALVFGYEDALRFACAVKNLGK